MSSGALTGRIAEASLGLKARAAGACWLLSVVAGVLAEFFVRGGLSAAAKVTAMSCSLAVTLLFYDLFQPVSRRLSFLAACCNAAVIALGTFKWHPRGVDIALIFFGVYCLLLGYLFFRSMFLPRVLGVLTAFAGLAWLSFLSPLLAKYLYPYNLAAGVLGQAVLCLWLLVIGINAQRWKQMGGAVEATAYVNR